MFDEVLKHCPQASLPALCGLRAELNHLGQLKFAQRGTRDMAALMSLKTLCVKKRCTGVS